MRTHSIEKPYLQLCGSNFEVSRVASTVSYYIESALCCMKVIEMSILRLLNTREQEEERPSRLVHFSLFTIILFMNKNKMYM